MTSTSDEPNNIATLFARSPYSQTEDDVKAIIKVLREKRALFKAGGSTGRAVKEPAKKINLDDLEL